MIDAITINPLRQRMIGDMTIRRLCRSTAPRFFHITSGPAKPAPSTFVT